MSKIKKIPFIWWVTGISFFGWLLWVYFDDTTTEVNRAFFYGLLFITFAMFTYIGIVIAKAKSPKITFSGGHDTWDPKKPMRIKSQKDEKGNLLLPDFLAVEGGGFKALGFYVPGGGRKGVHVFLDIHGAWEIQWPNLNLRYATRKTYRGIYEHYQLDFIYKRLKEQCDANGIRLEHEDPIHLYLIPGPEVGIKPEVVQQLSAIQDVVEYYGAIVGDREGEIKAMHQKAMVKHRIDFGPGFNRGEDARHTKTEEGTN